MDASSSSSSSSQRMYGVFLSFRGEDTRNTFADHLYYALCQRGIDTFIDSHKLRKGQVISPALVTAIENSMFSIIVLSQHYASSSWCLEELVKILESNTSKTERVLPIFYNVDPSDIRRRRGEFGKAFEGLVKNLEGWKKDRVEIWRKALTQVANIAGWDSRNRTEHMLIKEIINKVSNKLYSTYSSDDKKLVGMYSRIQEVESLLCIKSLDVRIIGISGMGGIGKTTLANAVYNRVSHQFESSVFLENVGEDLKIQGLIGWQQNLLSLLVDDGNLNIKGCTSIKGRLFSKKVLIVLDNVKDGPLLEFLTENLDSFGPGSRIIVTSRHQDLFTSHSVKYCEVRKLNEEEAMEVLGHYSLKHELPEDDLEELSERITNYAQGLPLALKVLGFLFGKKKPEWRSHLDKLKSSPPSEINKVLQISYNELDNKVKNLFLDIACFFKEEDKDHVTEILEACGFFAESGIGTLLDKSLITISNNKLQMHDLIQDMGMEVVRQKYPDDPGKWSRLWSHQDVSRVLKNNLGTEEVEGIFLNLSNLREIKFTSEGFARMNKLRLLKVYTSQISEGSKRTFQKEECKVQFSRNFKFHSNDLRYLYWHGYSLKSLPYEFNPENLVEMNMPYSHTEQLWKGKKDLEKLKFLKLSHSQFLEKTPDLSRATNLERLVLECCTHLRAVDPSFAVLKKLIFLNLRDSINLRHFPNSIELESLKILILSGCSKLRKFPEVSRSMKHLSELFLDGTAIEELPSSIEYATGLVLLDLTNCKELKSLPKPICNLESLETLLLSGCSKLENLPQNFGKLKGLRKLHADRTPLRGLPDSFFDLRSNIREVSFSGCKGSPTTASWLLPWKRSYSCDFFLPHLLALCSLKNLTLSDCNIVDGMQLDNLSLLSSLEKLNLSGNDFKWLPSSFCQLPKLRRLVLLNCRKLQALPELPSGIERINAHNCTSLGKISSQPLYTRIRTAIFTNCFELKDHQSNTKSCVETVVANVLLQRFADPKSRAEHVVFRTLIPGSGIPEWFIHQEEGSEVFIKLSSDWNRKNFLGFALCAVISVKDANPGVAQFLSLDVYYFDGGRKRYLDRRIDFIPSNFEDGLIKSDHIWLGYLLIHSLINWPSAPHITIALDTVGENKVIKNFGVRLVYTEDMRYNYATMIEGISDPQPPNLLAILEDSKVMRSPDGGEPSGIGLELENDDEYNTYEQDIPSGSGFHQNVEESVLEGTISRRILDEAEPGGNECSGNDLHACHGSKAEERKNIERRSHLQ